MIEARNITVRAGTFLLKNISFEIAEGSYAVLMGRTGSGKTTLLEALCGLREVEEGRIVLSGQDVTFARPANRGIGYVPQDRALFQTMTVRQNLAFALSLRKQPKPEVETRVRELAALLGIAHLLDRRPNGLSGGESQRVALGRALAAKPAFLCLDEPLSALDDETRDQMQQLLKSIQQQTGVTTLHVTHHQQEAAQMADTILLLAEGKICRST
ncbi:MAG TPA: ABC transporter ATP-binding protein [Verrucomicrobiae bacterium]